MNEPSAWQRGQEPVDGWSELASGSPSFREGPGQEEGGRQLLLVQAGLQTLCIDVLQVAEVIKRPRITPVAGTPPYHLGIASVRGVITPVVALASLLDVASGDPATRDDQRALVLRGNAPLALAVQAVRGVVRLSAHQWRASTQEPAVASVSWASHYVALSDGFTPVLAIEEVEQRICIAEAPSGRAAPTS